MRLLLIIFLILLYACNQGGKKYYSVDPKAKKLNDSAISLIMHSKNYAEAITLLDEATRIDSNYFLGYYNKLSFQLQLKQFDKALITVKQLNKMKPFTPDYYVTIGLIYEKTGDTISSKNYFNEAAKHYDTILDTMSVTNKEYNLLLMNRAINLVLIGQQQKGNDLLKLIYNKQKDELFKKEILEPYMNKSRQEIIELFAQGK